MELLYFYHLRASFIRVDEKTFSRKYRVRHFVFSISHPAAIPLLWMKQLYFLARHGRRSHCMVTMFAGYHSILPALYSRLTGKPLLIIAGGIDCVSFPSIGYGNFSKKFLGWLTCFSFSSASRIAPISEYLVDSYSPYPPLEQERKQGILRFCKVSPEKLKVIYNGFDTAFWSPVEIKREEKTCLCIVYGLDDPTRMVLKGVDLILKAACLLPDYRFVFAGVRGKINVPLPGNVEIKGILDPAGLRELYSGSSVYLQLSLSEGFGNTLAEAMLCECLPIGSAAGAIPMIIENNGFILEKKDVNDLAGLIKIACEKDYPEMRKAARESILNRFSAGKREQELLDLLTSFSHDN